MHVRLTCRNACRRVGEREIACLSVSVMLACFYGSLRLYAPFAAVFDSF